MGRTTKVSPGQYRDLFDVAPPCLITNSRGRILEANTSAAALLNVRPRDLLGKQIRSQIWKEDRRAFQIQLAHFSAKPQSAPFELHLQPHRRKSPLLASMLVRMSPRTSDRDGALLWFVSDRTVHRGIEQAFRDAADGILTLDDHHQVVLFNPAAEHMFGASAAEAVGQHITHFLPKGLPLPHSAISSVRDRSCKKLQRETLTAKVRGLHSNGVNFPLEASVAHLAAGRIHSFVVVLRNIFERGQAEETKRTKEHRLRRREMELKALTANLVEVQEEERRRIARELHDDLSQRMAALAVEAERITGLLPTTLRADLRASLRTLHAQAGQIAEDVHGLAYELHPSILDDLGLKAALKAYAEEFSKREQIPVTFRSQRLPHAIPSEIARCLYRVGQESLRNVAKHSRASHVTMKLVESGGWLGLSIQDNGVGFDVNGSRSGRLGLMSMRERVQTVSGVLHVLTAVGKGTTIVGWVPAKGRDET